MPASLEKGLSAGPEVTRVWGTLAARQVVSESPWPGTEWGRPSPLGVGTPGRGSPGDLGPEDGVGVWLLERQAPEQADSGLDSD